MSKESTEPDIEKLLADLRSKDDFLRKQAAETIDEEKIKDDRVIDAIKTIALADSNRIVKQTAVTTLLNLGIITPSQEESLQANEPPPEVELSRNEKIRDFAIGFLGWFVINGILWILLTGGTSNGSYGLPGWMSGSIVCLPFPLNILSLIILGLIKRTRRIAFGILVAIAVNLMISLFIGTTFNAFCFVPFYIK